MLTYPTFFFAGVGWQPDPWRRSSDGCQSCPRSWSCGWPSSGKPTGRLRPSSRSPSPKFRRFDTCFFAAALCIFATTPGFFVGCTCMQALQLPDTFSDLLFFVLRFPMAHDSCRTVVVSTTVVSSCVGEVGMFRGVTCSTFEGCGR